MELNCSDNRLTSLDVSQNTSLKDLSCDNNQFAVEIDGNGNFDLSTLPGIFNVKKASNWIGGTVNGNILTVDENVTEVTYTYDLGNNGKTETFKLAIERRTEPDFTVGDIDSNGEVDDWDAIVLNRYLAGWTTEINLAAADMDGDGELTDWDAIALERRLAGWDV